MWKYLTRMPTQKEMFWSFVTPLLFAPFMFLFLISRQGYSVSHFMPSLKSNSSYAFNKFLLDLSELGLDFPFVRGATEKIHAVRFAEMPPDVGGIYYALTNVIYLPLNLKDPETGGIKSLKHMTPFEISAVIHELWHCYYKKVLKYSPNPSFEEAQATYIGELARALIVYRKSLLNFSPLNRQGLSQILAAENTIRDKVTHREYFGYHTDWLRNEVVISDSPLPLEEKLTLQSHLVSQKVPAPKREKLPF